MPTTLYAVVATALRLVIHAPAAAQVLTFVSATGIDGTNVDGTLNSLAAR